MSKYFIDVIKNHYIDFSGKATRTQFWMFVLWLLIVGFVVFIISTFTFGILAGIYGLAMILPSLGIATRRLRDGGFTPWLIILVFIFPIIPLILWLFPSKR